MLGPIVPNLLFGTGHPLCEDKSRPRDYINRYFIFHLLNTIYLSLYSFIYKPIYPFNLNIYYPSYYLTINMYSIIHILIDISTSQYISINLAICLIYLIFIHTSRYLILSAIYVRLLLDEIKSCMDFFILDLLCAIIFNFLLRCVPHPPVWRSVVCVISLMWEGISCPPLEIYNLKC